MLPMRMQKKVIRKEDGRLLVYYHFPDSATEEETATFDSIEATGQEGIDQLKARQAPAQEEGRHV
jgi:hypothetical protein